MSHDVQMYAELTTADKENPKGAERLPEVHGSRKGEGIEKPARGRTY